VCVCVYVIKEGCAQPSCQNCCTRLSIEPKGDEEMAAAAAGQLLSQFHSSRLFETNTCTSCRAKAQQQVM
jgi:hypothetical protein